VEKEGERGVPRKKRGGKDPRGPLVPCLLPHMRLAKKKKGDGGSRKGGKKQHNGREIQPLLKITQFLACRRRGKKENMGKRKRGRGEPPREFILCKSRKGEKDIWGEEKKKGIES